MGKDSFGDLQAAIMDVLWTRDEATVVEVQEALADRGLAPTTLATMLRKLEAKGSVAHRSVGRRFIYRALVSRQEARRSMVRELLDRVFSGDPKALLSHLVGGQELDQAELDRVRDLIAADEEESR